MTSLRCSVKGAQPPVDVTAYALIRKTPLIMAGLLVLLALAMMAHTLVTSVRRRRRDLAILKTVGFVRHQVRAAVAWQATVLAVIPLVVGLPLGVAAGRWAWSLFASQLGVPAFTIIPMAALLLAIPATLLLANLIAAWPARSAARTRPTIVLRSE
jgi:ABC-type lipoprotein release transport system permease subunit